jgi:osmotically-inducible protein OsmY
VSVPTIPNSVISPWTKSPGCNKPWLQVVSESAEETTAEQDEVVQQRVEEALDAREDLDDIEVEVADGVARLTGEVDSVTTQLAAATLVRSVQGVKSVVNDLRLAPRTS